MSIMVTCITTNNLNLLKILLFNGLAFLHNCIRTKYVLIVTIWTHDNKMQPK